MPLSSRNDREILKVNDPFLILEGRRAASWLAMRGYKIGLATPACYGQEEGAVFKLNHHICIVNSSGITRKIERDWINSAPDGVALHRPGPNHIAQLNALMQQRA